MDEGKELSRIELQQRLDRVINNVRCLYQELAELKQGSLSMPMDGKVGIEVGKVIAKYETFEDWEESPPQQSMFYRKVRDMQHISIDSAGRLCFSTHDYNQARDDGAYPITIYERVHY